MLVLSRRLNESIVIGDNVTITVLEVRGDVVRIGIDAPRSVVIHRQEVHDALMAANESASKVGNVDMGKLPMPAMPPKAAPPKSGPPAAGSKSKIPKPPSS